MKIIFQILGRFNYQVVEYMYNKRVYNTRLSSFVLFDNLKNEEKDVYLYFVVPESLVTLMYDSLEQASNALKDVSMLMRDARLKVEENLGKDPHFVKDFKVLPLQSSGIFSRLEKDKGKRVKYKVRFDNDIENIMSYALLELLKTQEITRDKNVEMYFDISSGFNAYVTAFYEALRTFILYQKFSYAFQNIENEQNKNFFTSRYPRLYISYVDPIIPGADRAKIEIYERIITPSFQLPRNIFTLTAGDLSHRVFSHNGKGEHRKVRIPFVREPLDVGQFLVDDNLERIRKIYSKEMEEDIKKYIFKIVEIIFNSIRYNTLLALYHDEIVYYTDLLENNKSKIPKYLERIYEYLTFLKKLERIKVNENELLVERLAINNDALKATLLSLAMLDSFVRYAQKENLLFIKQVPVQKLRENAKYIYRQFDLKVNQRFLERDLKELDYFVENYCKKTKVRKAEVLYNELFSRENTSSESIGKIEMQSQKRLLSDEERNFFAHSGLSRNEVILLIDCNGKHTYLKYNPKRIDIIRKWILSVR